MPGSDSDRDESKIRKGRPGDTLPCPRCGDAHVLEQNSESAVINAIVQRCGDVSIMYVYDAALGEIHGDGSHWARDWSDERGLEGQIGAYCYSIVPKDGGLWWTYSEVDPPRVIDEGPANEIEECHEGIMAAIAQMHHAGFHPLGD